MKLAVVVGHEKVKPGARIGAPLNTYEYAYNTQVASVLFMFARDKKLECQVFFRDKIGISGVAKKVNEWTKKDAVSCVLELHCNSAENKSAAGTETLFSMHNPLSIELARIVQADMCSLFKRDGKQNRGIKSLNDGDRGAVNLNLYDAPSVICEPAFGSNANDCHLLWANPTGYSRVLVNATISFLEGIKNGKF